MKGYIKQKEDTRETRQRKVPSLSGEKKKKKERKIIQMITLTFIFIWWKIEQET